VAMATEFVLPMIFIGLWLLYQLVEEPIAPNVNFGHNARAHKGDLRCLGRFGHSLRIGDFFTRASS
jgi:hypothetical protein